MIQAEPREQDGAAGRLLPAQPDRRALLAPLTIFVLAVALSSLSLATPGYFSHDELLPAPSALRDLLPAFVQFDVLPFYRPLPFVLLRAVMGATEGPFAPHALLVAFHAACSTAVFLLVRRYDRTAAPLCGLLFAASPLAAFAVGWVAALFDVMAAGLMVSALCCAALHARRPTPATWAGFTFCTLAALLSKETALVLPAYVGLLSLVETKVGRRRLWGLGLCSAGAVGGYLVLRGAAFLTIASTGTADYSVAPTAFLRNVLAYAAFPLRLESVDAGSILEGAGLIPSLLSAMITTVVITIGGLVRDVGWRRTGLSVALAGLYLLPVIALQKHETQYLYGAAPGLSYLVARMILSRNLLAKAVSIAFSAGMTVHTLNIQLAMYRDGVCQARLIQSIDARESSGQQDGSRPIKVWPEPGSRAWVLTRLAVADHRLVPTPDAATADALMSPDCGFRPPIIAPR